MFPLPDDPPCRAVRFELVADPEPGLLCRALGPFARRDIVPDRVRAHREGATMRIEIAVDAMPSAMLHLVEGNLRQIVGVRRLAVMLCGGQRPQIAARPEPKNPPSTAMTWPVTKLASSEHRNTAAPAISSGRA